MVIFFLAAFMSGIYGFGAHGWEHENNIPNKAKTPHHPSEERPAHSAVHESPATTPSPVSSVSPSQTPATVALATPTPAVTPSPVQSAKPSATATPAATVALTGPQAEGFDKAAGLPGEDDVRKIGKNPVFGDAAATEKGKALFAQNCASCHGDAGDGTGPAGAALDPKPRNLTHKAEYKYGTGDLSIFRTVKYGAPASGMAPWDGRMSDDECWDCVNFVKTLQGG
jgi:mono/diheme cytochrome c family protein